MEVVEAASFLYNKNQIVQKSYLLILQTGKYKEACIKWNRKAMENQLWPIFKSHLSKAHHENRHIKQATAQVSGFANAAVSEENNRYDIEMTTEIQTLVEETEMERIHVANLTAEKTNLTSAITTIITEMETTKNLMRKVQSK